MLDNHYIVAVTPDLTPEFTFPLLMVISMRTEDLQYFLAVARAGKLGSATDIAGISQPGLTKAIARLELELGGPLFLRTGRGMQLTELGRSFETRANRIVDELGIAMEEARTLHPLQGVLRIGVAPSIEPLLAPACARLMTRRPLLRVELMVLITDYLVSAVGSGRLDLAIAARLRDMPDDLSFIHVGEDERHIVVSAEHELARAGAPVMLKDLVDHDWALPRKESAVRRYVEEAFASKGLRQPVIRLENEFSMSAYSIISECGLLAVTTPYVFGMVPSQHLVALKVLDFEWKREIGILVKRDGSANPLVQDFIDLLLDDMHPIGSHSP